MIKRGHCCQRNLGKRGGVWPVGKRWLLAGLVLMLGTTTTWGQTVPQKQPNKTYLNKNVVVLPINFDPRFRDELREVQLYMKDNPTQAWKLQDRAQPSKTEFTFRTIQDGEYWFTLVTLDRQGRLNPPDIRQTSPALVVVIDRKPPEVEIRLLPSSAAEGPTFQVSTHDANPNPMRTQFEYQTGDKQWRSADHLPNRPDTFAVPPQAVFTGQVRATVTDLASNTTQREVNVADCVPAGGSLSGSTGIQLSSGVNLPGRPGGTDIRTVGYRAPATERTESPFPPPPPNRGTTTVPPAPPSSAETPLPPPILPLGAQAPAVLPAQLAATHQETTKEKVKEPSAPVPVPRPTQVAKATPVVPEAVPAAGVPTTKLVQGKSKQVVKTTRVTLEYQIDQTGPSGIGKVEVWLTCDRGQKWHRLCEDTDRVSPVEVDLPGEGEYGLALTVTNGRGFGGEPPASGTVPEWSIEVDTIRPVAEFQTIRPLTGGEGGNVLISWVARDRNFGPEPIDLFYATEREGPWKLIAKGIANEGRHRWTAPAEAGGKVYLRLVAVDQAGNLCQCETEQPILVDDLSRPRVRVLGINTQVEAPHPTPGGALKLP